MSDSTDCIADLLASIEAKRAEQVVLLDTLRLWNDVKAQGIEPDSVRAFTFANDATDTKTLRSLLHVSPLEASTRSTIIARASRFFHNVAILKTGERVILDPPIRKPNA